MDHVSGACICMGTPWDSYDIVSGDHFGEQTAIVFGKGQWYHDCMLGLSESGLTASLSHCMCQIT